MDHAQVVLPPQLDGRNVLVLPRGADVLALAGAWFPEAAWTREPVAAASAAPMRGARFRGMAVEATAPVPGLITLTSEAGLEGPTPVDREAAQRAGLGARDVDAYALELAAGEPAGPSPDAVYGWMSAAGRRIGGAIVPADRSHVITPDPGAAVDLTLWSPICLSVADALPLVRPAMSGARVGAADVSESGFSVTATFEYDGAIVLRTGRSDEIPVALSRLDWREYGPWSYQVHWEPPEPEELLAPTPSQLHLIARSRVQSSVARVAAALWRGAGGTVVDSGGFVVSPDELREMGTAGR